MSLMLRTMFVCAFACFATGIRASEPTVPLGRAADFAVLGFTAVNNAGSTAITGDVGVSPGSFVTGFPPGIISGSVHTGNVASADAQADLTIAYNDAAARTPDVLLASTEIGGLTLTGGVYQSSGPIDITAGDLTLNGRGNPNTVFIFQTGGSLTIAAGRRVLLINSARASRVFWQLGGDAILAGGSVMKGNLLVNNSITTQNGANLEGRALALNGSPAINATTIRVPSGSGAPPTGTVVIESASVVSLNPQTGLFEQTIRIQNAGSNAIAAAQVWLKNVPLGVTVYNAVGRTPNLHPYVVYNRPLAVGSSVDLVIEYFRATRRPFLAPSAVAKPIAPVVFSGPRGERQRILRKIPIGTDQMLVEFVAISALRYAVQYSDDGIIWKTAQPDITARADRVFWMDYGAPKTEGTPTSARSYRVARLF